MRRSRVETCSLARSDKYYSYAVKGEEHAPMTNDEYDDRVKQAREPFDIATIKCMQERHDKFGRPPSRALATALTNIKCADNVVRCAQMYVRAKFAQNDSDRVTIGLSLPTATKFDQVVGVDTFQAEWDGEPRKSFNIMDENSCD